MSDSDSCLSDIQTQAELDEDQIEERQLAEIQQLRATIAHFHHLSQQQDQIRTNLTQQIRLMNQVLALKYQILNTQHEVFRLQSQQLTTLQSQLDQYQQQPK